MPINLFPRFLILFATLLVAMGDLRNLTSPLGYWVLWGSWSVIAIIFSFRPMTTFFCRPVARLIVQPNLFLGFLGLFISFAAASGINGDIATLYHGSKFIVIALIGVLIFNCSRPINGRGLYFISLLAIGLSFSIFEYSRLFNLDWYVELGDGRRGNIIAYPGVMWKTGAFFAPFLLAKLSKGPGNKIPPLIGLLLAIYLIVQDGSRTGFFWLVICIGLFSVAWALNSLRQSPLILLIWIFLTLMAVAVVLPFAFDAPADDLLFLPYARLLGGDPVRSAMLSDGIDHALDCLPLGCGFATSVSITADGPMVVHNAFISSIGDVGILGFLCLSFLILYPIVEALTIWRRKGLLVDYYRLAALMGVLGFLFIMLFHPLTTEMSEWGLYFLMVSWLRSLSSGDANFSFENR